MKKTFLTLAIVIANYCAYAQSYLPLTGGTLNGGLLINNSYFVLQASGTNIFASGSSAVVVGSGSGTDYINYVYGNNPFTIWTNNAKRFIIDGSGNVGIGTTSPGSQLDIYHNGTGASLRVGGYAMGTSNDAGIDLYVNNANNVPAYARIALGVNTASIGSESGYLAFSTINSGSLSEKMRITKEGYVGIGTTDTKGYLFAVNGNAIATSVTVKLYDSWPDYVFKKSYKLPSLLEVQNYIDKNQHLPDMPSEADVAKNGINLGEIVKLQTKKIEELTLYMIDKDKEVHDLQDEVNQLKQQNQRITALETALFKLTANK